MLTEENNEEEKVMAEPILVQDDNRIDDHGREMFRGMGYEHLTDTQVGVYKEFRRRKDRIYPSKVTPEGFAFITMLVDMIEGDLEAITGK